jgi:glycosyltransferase involved in cell wall biosynthesis
MLITVFTPTYNRASLLLRLYDSLCKQTFNDFEWLIVDDGSQDDTERVVNTFIADGKLDIRYIKQANGGKHRAINRGVRVAKGELFFIVDSDDWLPNDSLETITMYYSEIKDDRMFAGVSGLDGFDDGKNIGDSLPQETIDCNSLDLRFKYKVSGDMSEVFRTEIMKEFPFPEIDGEKFCSEAVVWNRIANKYKLRYFNKIIYTAEYQPDGITSGIVKARMNSPIASMICYSELCSYRIPFLQKVKAAINYWRFRFCSKIDAKPTISLLWSWTIPLGHLMHLKDIKETK